MKLKLTSEEWYPVYNLSDSTFAFEREVSEEDAEMIKNLMEIRNKAEEDLWVILDKYEDFL